MRNRSLFLIFFAAFAVFLCSIASVSAQEIDISSLSEEQRTILLISLLQQMQQENADPIPTPMPTATPTPVPAEIRLEDYGSDQLNALLYSLLTQMQLENGVKMPDEGLNYLEPTQTPQPSMESEPFHIYENKKLTTEQLPGYMFIQKESTPEPEKNEEESNYDMLRKTYGPDFEPEKWDSYGWDWSITDEGQISGLRG